MSVRIYVDLREEFFGVCLPEPRVSRTALAGRILVALQFALLAWLVWPTRAPTWSIAAFALFLCSGVLGAWTLLHNRPGNFNVRPEPKARARLVTTGPYRYVRNPMYCAVLLFALAAVCVYADALKVAAWFALALVLVGKALLEERGLAAKFDGYAEYTKRVRRFIPGLF